MSLDGIYDHMNIFAKIVRGDAQAVKIHEDADTLSFMDIFPQSPGHCLVIPKNIHARNLLDFPPEKLGVLFRRVQLVSAAVVKALRPDGVTIMQFNGAPAGQTVFHLHVHILPRYTEHELKRHGPGGGQMANMDDLREQAKQIAAALEG
jgi:histidine triad (HIT) family protein